MATQQTSWSADLREPERVTATRHHIIASLRQLLPDSDLANAELTLSELLGNVQRHTPGPAQITIHQTRGRLILTVADQAPPFTPPDRLPDDPLGPDGRGLFLVAQLSGPISIDQTPDGWKTVTVTLPIDSGST